MFTTSVNLKFLIPAGTTGNLQEFNWSFWKFLTNHNAMTTKKSSHEKFSSSPVVWKVVIMIMYISCDGYV